MSKTGLALYDYSAESDAELTFQAGDSIELLQQDDSGWSEGSLKGNSGWFPSSYIDVSDSLSSEREEKELTDPADPAIVARIKEAIESSDDQEEIELSGLQLTETPKTLFEGAPFVRSLNISFNAFEQFPVLEMFGTLEEIDLSGCPIKDIGTEVGFLPVLKELKLNGCRITSLPVEIGKLVNLQRLSLANNKLESIPEEVGSLDDLEEIDLNGNPISELPNSIGNWTNLEIFDASNCKLTKLPSQFSKLTSLLELNLAKNKLETLHREIGSLSRLSSLNLQDNELSDLPQSLAKCQGLVGSADGLKSKGNPFKDMKLFRAAGLGSEEVFEYLKSRPENGITSIEAAAIEDLEANKSQSPFSLVAELGSSKPKPVMQTQQQSNSDIPKPTVDPTEQPKEWGLFFVNHTMRVAITDLQKQIDKSFSKEELVVIAKLLRRIEKPLNNVKMMVPSLIVAPRKFRPIPCTADILADFKLVINYSVEDIAFILKGVLNTLESPNPKTKFGPLVSKLDELLGEWGL